MSIKEDLRDASVQYSMSCGHDSCDCNNAFVAGANWQNEQLTDRIKQLESRCETFCRDAEEFSAKGVALMAENARLTERVAAATEGEAMWYKAAKQLMAEVTEVRAENARLRSVISEASPELASVESWLRGHRDEWANIVRDIRRTFAAAVTGERFPEYSQVASNPEEHERACTYDGANWHCIQGCPVSGKFTQQDTPAEETIAMQRERCISLQTQVNTCRAALKYIVERENFAFAECSEAEEIWSRAKEALRVSNLDPALQSEHVTHLLGQGRVVPPCGTKLTKDVATSAVWKNVTCSACVKWLRNDLEREVSEPATSGGDHG